VRDLPAAFFKIREVLALRDAGTAPCHHVQQTLQARLRSLDKQIGELTALRDTVAESASAPRTPTRQPVIPEESRDVVYDGLGDGARVVTM
jgi:DNA-binding transcriptional MerR regulator